MRNYLESPTHFKSPYSVYLIQKPQALTTEMIEELYKAILPSRAILSFERLFKGSKRAVVIFGPVDILKTFHDRLGLLELEDYTKRATLANITGWEVGGKIEDTQTIHVPRLIDEIPSLEETEEFWWQLCLHPTQNGLEKAVNKIVQSVTNESYRMALERQKKSTPQDSAQTNEQQKQSDGALFNAVLRAIVSSPNTEHLESLKNDLAKVGEKSGLVKLPQVFTSRQVVDLYQKRALPIANRSQMTLTAKEIISLLGVV